METTTPTRKAVRFGCTIDDTNAAGEFVWWLQTLDDDNEEPIAGGFCRTEADARNGASAWLRMNPEYSEATTPTNEARRAASDLRDEDAKWIASRRPISAGERARIRHESRTADWGAGWCAVGTARFVHVVAESLSLARTMWVSKLPLVKVRQYAANPRRQHYIFSR